jgi:hypothetical protein
MLISPNPTFVSLFAFLFPFANVILCWHFFYSLDHFPHDRTLTISKPVISFPENQIFAIGTHVEILVSPFA